ncbi:MAG: sodium:solute symporter [Armatimonadota bacterium]
MPAALAHTNFTAADWAIVVVYLLGSVAIGVWANRYVANLADFIVAGRGLKVALAVATMTGTELGLVTVMYNAQEGYTRGFSAYMIGVCWFLAYLSIGLTGFIVFRLRQSGVMTIPEYYERRYSRRTRVLGGAILALSGILNMGLFLQAGSRFVAHVTGLSAGTPLKLVMTGMLVLVLIYTTLGGMISVVITDLVQFIVLGLSMVVATVAAVRYVDWGHMIGAVQEFRGQGGLDPFVSPPDGYGWLYMVWMVYVGLAAGTLWQAGTFRALAARSPRVAKQMYAWSSITFLSRVVLPATWGIAALAYIAQTPELSSFFLARGAPSWSGQIAMPVFFAHNLPPIFLGILTAGMMAAFMSTHDSYLLAWSAVITQDVIAPLRRRPLSDRGRILVTRVLIVAIGIFLLVWGLWFEARTTLWQYMAVTGTIYFAGAFVCVAFGLYWRRASSAGALAALACGLVAVLAVAEKDPTRSTLISAGTIGLCLAAMIVGSLLFPRREEPPTRIGARGEAP